jgi:hypothetical protein
VWYIALFYTIRAEPIFGIWGEKLKKYKNERAKLKKY